MKEHIEEKSGTTKGWQTCLTFYPKQDLIKDKISIIHVVCICCLSTECGLSLSAKVDIS